MLELCRAEKKCTKVNSESPSPKSRQQKKGAYTNSESPSPKHPPHSHIFSSAHFHIYYPMSDIHLSEEAAVVGGIHSDSHNVTTTHTTTNTSNTITDNSKTVNTHVVHQAQLTDTQILQDNENQFLQAVINRMQDGILSQQDLAALTRISLQCHLSPQRASAIIEQVRQSASTLKGSQGNEYLASQILQEVFQAIQHDEVEILQHKFRPLEQLARTSTDGNVQCYYHMLLASLYPENCTVAFINSRTDNYWQLFWAHVAYVKLGNTDNATVLLPRLGGFGAPQGDIALLMAIDNLADWRKHNDRDYYRQQAEQYLNEACEAGMSEALSPLWYAAQTLLEHDDPQPEDWYCFFCEHTLKELQAVKQPSVSKSAPTMPTPPPSMPKFNAQSVQLKQSQGFNPLQAAQQLGMGQMATLEQVQQQMAQMQQRFENMANGWDNGLSQPSALNKASIQGVPTMPQTPAVPPLPQTPPMPQSSIEVAPSQPSTVQPEDVEQYGVIFTDSVKLSYKYSCQPSDVYAVINQLIQQSEQHLMHWYLFDAANEESLKDNDFWGDYNDALEKFLTDNGFQLGIATPVWIIGGADVIPIPTRNANYGGEDIPTDMPYCYYTGFFDDLWNGDHTLCEPRNTIARLPLESGEMQTRIEDDLGSYFNLCAMTQGEIAVDGVVMASNSSWRDNSVTMSHHLPLVHANSADTQEVDEGMYMCPKLVSPAVQQLFDAKVYNDYMQAIASAGMLVFNLHGSNDESMPNFYSDNGEAVTMDMMKQANSRVLNTVACFGARYDGYSRDKSMLFSSLLGGGQMLYAGASVSVPMLCDEDQTWPEGMTQLPGSGSEKFMPIYCYYQFCGLPAGQAMMRAKLDYFNTFRHMERDDFSFDTITMFGLYGNPMLHVRRREDVIKRSQELQVLPQLPQSKAANASLCHTATKCLLSKEQLSQSKSLLDQIRFITDSNLQAIHQGIQQYLYDALGLDPRWLDQVDAFTYGNKKSVQAEGYRYCYDINNQHHSKTIVEVNKQGQVTRRITFK